MLRCSPAFSGSTIRFCALRTSTSGSAAPTIEDRKHSVSAMVTMRENTVLSSGLSCQCAHAMVALVCRQCMKCMTSPDLFASFQTRLCIHYQFRTPCMLVAQDAVHTHQPDSWRELSGCLLLCNLDVAYKVSNAALCCFVGVHIQ